MALVEGEDARTGSVLKRSLAGHGVGLEGIDGRGDGVVDVGLEVGQGIEQVARLRAVELQVEMRALGRTRIAAEPDKLSFVDRHHRCREGDVGGIDLVGVLVALHGGLDLRGEVVEMDIDRGVAVGMAHIDGLAKPMRAHGDLADETVGHGVERLARHAVGLDVDAGMEMVRSRLAEVARQLDGVVDGRDIGDRGQQKTCEHRLTRWP